MNVRLLIGAIALALLITACGGSLGETPSALDTQNNASDRYVVVFNGNGIPARGLQAIEAAGGQIVRTLPQVGVAVAVSSNPSFSAQASRGNNIQAVGVVPATEVPNSHEPNVDVLDAPTPADDLYNDGLVWGVNRVKAPQAWAAGHTGSHDTVIAVIDTGIATNHPDLTDNIMYTNCFVSTGNQADGACSQYPSFSDHGTHVAGTIAAAFGGGSVVGVGPNLGLAGYNTFEPIEGCGICTWSDTRWEAMIDAADQGFDAINMSLGSLQMKGGKGSNDLNAFIQAENRVARYVLKAGTVLVASAGNSNVNLNGLLYNTPGGVPGIINVGATGIRPEPRYPQEGAYDVRAFFSNYGAQVTLVAPGGDCGLPNDCNLETRAPDYFEHLILSAVVTPSAACAATESCPVGYNWKGGTSMAAPHVSGVVGLVRDAHPNMTARQVVSVVKRTAENLGDRQQFGHGMVDAERAVQ